MSKAQADYSIRINHLRQSLENNQAILLSAPADVDYLTGFRSLVPEEREAFLIITSKKAVLLHASLSPYQAVGGLEVVVGCSQEKLGETLKKITKEQKLKSLLFDATNLVVTEYQPLKKINALKLQPFPRQQLWHLRSVKDQAEIELLSQAASMTSQVMKKILGELKAGIIEEKLRNQIEAELKRKGSEKIAFPTIVAFGDHSALPHHQPTTRRLKKEMVVLLDFGATVGGYRGDMTRTVWFGDKPSPKFMQLEKIVKQAYQATIKQLQTRGRQKILAKDLDQTARAIITQAGFGQNFIHTTGHGLGLDIHESLSLSWKNEQPILPQMVITIEPGIYVEGELGYRYENTVLVTKTGAEELT